MRGTKTLAAFGLAALVGYGGTALHVPLAWMLGSLLVAACLSMAGANLKPNQNFRRLGQLTIGAAVGLSMTAPVLLQLGSWLPLMVFSALFSVLTSCIIGAVLAKFAGLDQQTAFFGSLPGGLAEMANIGASMGAQSEPIAIIQTLRVTLVVLTVPPILIALGTPDFAATPASGIITPYWAVGLIAGSACVAYVFRLARLNNPYMIGAVVFTALFAASGAVTGKMPPLLFSLAQLLIGFAVGCQFSRAMLAKLPRVTFFGILAVLEFVLIMAGYGLLISLATGLAYPVAVLATSPGGMSEMAVTAQVLHLAIPTVVGFQVVRGVLVNSFASHYFALLTKAGLFRLLQRLLRNPAGSP